MARACTVCGQELAERVRFCPRCGSPGPEEAGLEDAGPAVRPDPPARPAPPGQSAPHRSAPPVLHAWPEPRDAPLPPAGTPAPSPDRAPSPSGGDRRGRSKTIGIVVGVVLIALTAVLGIRVLTRDTPTAGGSSTSSTTSAAAVAGAATSATGSTTASSTSTSSTSTSNTSTSATSSSGSPAHPDPAIAPPVENIRTFAEAVPFAVDCPGTVQEADWEFEASGTWGPWIALRYQDYLALVNRLDQSTLWCSPVGLGGTDSAPDVPSESPVGRPGYTPALDEDTKAAAWPAGNKPALVVADDRLWLIQRIEIVRPEILSQQARSYDAFIGMDDTGEVRWLSQLGAPSDIEGVATTLRRDEVTGELAVTHTWSGQDGPIVRIAPVDPATGRAGKAWTPDGVNWDGDSSIALVGGDVVYTAERSTPDGTTYRVVATRTSTGKQVTGAGPWSREPVYWAEPSHLLIQGQTGDYGEPTNKLRVISYADGSAREITAPFPVALGECHSNAAAHLVCTGARSGGTDTIAALDLAAGKVTWSWQTGDPDPKTGVPRTVPSGISAHNDYIYATNPDNVRYVLDLATGEDLGLETDVDEVDDAYGPVTAGYSGISWASPLP